MSHSHRQPKATGSSGLVQWINDPSPNPPKTIQSSTDGASTSFQLSDSLTTLDTHQLTCSRHSSGSLHSTSSHHASRPVYSSGSLHSPGFLHSTGAPPPSHAAPPIDLTELIVHTVQQTMTIRAMQPTESVDRMLSDLQDCSKSQQKEIHQHQSDLQMYLSEIHNQLSELRQQHLELKQQQSELRQQQSELRQQQSEFRQQQSQLRHQAGEHQFDLFKQ